MESINSWANNDENINSTFKLFIDNIILKLTQLEQNKCSLKEIIKLKG